MAFGANGMANMEVGAVGDGGSGSRTVEFIIASASDSLLFDLVEIVFLAETGLMADTSGSFSLFTSSSIPVPFLAPVSKYMMPPR